MSCGEWVVAGPRTGSSTPPSRAASTAASGGGDTSIWTPVCSDARDSSEPAASQHACTRIVRFAHILLPPGNTNRRAWPFD